MNNRSGLSLFELLVALALLALVAAGMAGTMGLAINFWDRTSGFSEPSQQVALRSRLRILMRKIQTPGVQQSFMQTFEGRVDGFSFVTLADRPHANSTSALQIAVHSDSGILHMEVSELDMSGEILASETRVLATNISPEFSYYDGSLNASGWRNEWQEAYKLPDLIRIEAPAGSRPDWPEFTVRPLR